RLQEGDQLLTATLEGRPDDPSLRYHLLARQAAIRISLGQYELAQDILQESITLARTADEVELLAYSLNLLARTKCYLGSYIEAEQFCRQSLSHYEQLGNQWGKARCIHVF